MTAKIHGLMLSGDFEVYEDCAVAKARQKSINKVWKGGRVEARFLVKDFM